MTNAIETQQLTRAFGQRVAVNQLTLTVPEGTVFGFLGPNGAGKTTTVRLLTSLIAPSHGSAMVNGFALGTEDHKIRSSVGILTETPGLYDRLNALQNLTFFARLYGLSTQRATEQAKRHLRMLDLWERRHDLVGSFSKGMRQKLAIARALLHEPRLIFLDEPTSGLDPEAARMVRTFLKTLRSEGRTIFLTTHNLPEADELCDLIGVFRGTLLRVDSPTNLRAELSGHSTTITVANEASHWLPTVQALSFVHQVTAHTNQLTISLDRPDEQNPVLVTALVQAGASIRAVVPRTYSLEEVYLQLLESQQPDTPEQREEHTSSKTMQEQRS